MALGSALSHAVVCIVGEPLRCGWRELGEVQSQQT
jgi:hypothetical protein